MSLTEQNHTNDTHQQLDDELLHSLLDGTVDHPLHGEERKSCLKISVIKSESSLVCGQKLELLLAFFLMAYLTFMGGVKPALKTLSRITKETCH